MYLLHSRVSDRSSKRKSYGFTMNNNAAIPVGFRFHPTDEELVGYYLHGKVTRNQQDQIILELDLYKIEPWDLHEVCRIGDDAPENQNNWYFFSHKDKKYPTGNRANRATAAGFWKATGRDKPIHTQHVIGMRKTLVFYKGRAPHGQKTDWIMHEFRLDEGPGAFPNFESDGWVVCRVFRKTKNFKTKSQETSASFEEEQQLSLLPELTSSPEKFSSDGGGDAGDDGGGDVDYPQSLHNMNHLHHHFTLMCAKQEISVDDYGSAVTATAVGHHPHHDHLPTFIDHHNLHHLADLQKFATSHHLQTPSHHHHSQQTQSLAPCSSSTFRTIPSISSIPTTSRRQDDHNASNNSTNTTNTNTSNNNYSVLPAFHNLDPASIACSEFDRASSAACNQLATAAAAAAAQDEGAGHCSNFNPVDAYWMLPEEPRDMRFHHHPVTVQARLDQTLADVTCHVNQLKQQPLLSASTQQQINNHHHQVAGLGLAAEHHHLTSTHEMAQLWNV